MTPAELSARLAELQREEWHKEPGGLDGGQNDRALARLVGEVVGKILGERSILERGDPRLNSRRSEAVEVLACDLPQEWLRDRCEQAEALRGLSCVPEIRLVRQQAPGRSRVDLHFSTRRLESGEVVVDRLLRATTSVEWSVLDELDIAEWRRFVEDIAATQCARTARDVHPDCEGAAGDSPCASLCDPCRARRILKC